MPLARTIQIRDWKIGNFELLDTIDNWAGGGLGNFELLDLIDYWAFGSYCFDVVASTHKADTPNANGACPGGIVTGTFTDSPVDGLSYQTDSLSGITDQSGQFNYVEGETVTFSIGNITLGQAVGETILTPLSLVPEAADITETEVSNIIRSLQTIDADSDPTNGIEITESLRQAADTLTVQFNLTQAEFEAQPDLQTLLNTVSADTDLVDSADALQHFKASLEDVYSDALSEVALLKTTDSTDMNVAIHSDGTSMVVMDGDTALGEKDKIV